MSSSRRSGLTSPSLSMSLVSMILENSTLALVHKSLAIRAVIENSKSWKFVPIWMRLTCLRILISNTGCAYSFIKSSLKMGIEMVRSSFRKSSDCWSFFDSSSELCYSIADLPIKEVFWLNSSVSLVSSKSNSSFYWISFLCSYFSSFFWNCYTSLSFSFSSSRLVNNPPHLVSWLRFSFTYLTI